jgi:hypothetical protein
MNTGGKDSFKFTARGSGKAVGDTPSNAQLPKARIRVLIADDMAWCARG